MVEIAFWILVVVNITIAIIGSVYYLSSNKERQVWADKYYVTMKFAIKHLSPTDLRELEQELGKVK